MCEWDRSELREKAREEAGGARTLEPGPDVAREEGRRRSEAREERKEDHDAPRRIRLDVALEEPPR